MALGTQEGPDRDGAELSPKGGGARRIARVCQLVVPVVFERVRQRVVARPPPVLLEAGDGAQLAAEARAAGFGRPRPREPGRKARPSVSCGGSSA